MKMSELREKTEKELEGLRAGGREAVRAARFKVAFKQLKNVREIRAQKRLIAQTSTVLRARTTSKI